MPSRVDRPIIRKRDHKPVGTLTVAWRNHWRFTDDEGCRLGTRLWADMLLVTQPPAAG